MSQQPIPLAVNPRQKSSKKKLSRFTLSEQTELHEKLLQHHHHHQHNEQEQLNQQQEEEKEQLKNKKRKLQEFKNKKLPFDFYDKLNIYGQYTFLLSELEKESNSLNEIHQKISNRLHFLQIEESILKKNLNNENILDKFILKNNKLINKNNECDNNVVTPLIMTPLITTPSIVSSPSIILENDLENLNNNTSSVNNESNKVVTNSNINLNNNLTFGCPEESMNMENIKYNMPINDKLLNEMINQRKYNSKSNTTTSGNNNNSENINLNKEMKITKPIISESFKMLEKQIEREEKEKKD
ncbi:hypothetical protein ABK040_015813 [Willaertia magna]